MTQIKVIEAGGRSAFEEAVNKALLDHGKLHSVNINKAGDGLRYTAVIEFHRAMPIKTSTIRFEPTFIDTDSGLITIYECPNCKEKVSFCGCKNYCSNCGVAFDYGDGDTTLEDSLTRSAVRQEEDRP